MLGVAVVGFILVWLIATQEQEKKLRQKVADDLQILNDLSATLCQSLDLDIMLGESLGKALEVVHDLKPKGAVFLLDPWGQTLQLRVFCGLAAEFVQQASEIPVGECLCGMAAESEAVMLVPDAIGHPGHSRCLVTEPHAHICIPLRSKKRLQGVIDLCVSKAHPVDDIDRELFASMGRQIGVAIENARLYENLRFYIGKITSAQENERHRIARELHDETAQGLIDLSRRLDGLAVVEPGLSESTTERLEDLQQRIEELLQGVRRYSRDLRPSVLDDLGLGPALEGLVADAQAHGIESKLIVEGEPRRLPAEAELALYRIGQEALNNIKRHAVASRATLTVAFGRGRVAVTVQDNGQGFDLPGRMTDLVAAGRFGLVGMEERTHLLHGQLTVQSQPGEGTTVVVSAPA
jgi:signal transduction histidine kinase